MDLNVSRNGFVEVYDPDENQFYFQCFYNLKKVVKGKGFFVVQLKSGRVEAYNYHLDLIGYKVFHGMINVKAGQNIKVYHENGSFETYDRYLHSVNS